MIVLIVYSLVLLIYSVFSYSLTDPNLVLTPREPYWSFQQWMWQTFFENRELMTYVYVGIVAVAFALYWAVTRYFNRKNVRLTLITYLLILSPLLLAYNALSHDVFNYIFNAKMVRVYQADPHNKVALDFPQDDWLRFMHNTHTPAPYGYGWTAMSLVPSAIGMDKFVITWELFRLFSVVSLVLLFGTYALYQWITGKQVAVRQLALVLFNPLLLIEIIGNQHNDLWMMVPAMVSLIMLLNKKMRWWLIVISAALLLISISTKLATALLIPIWVGLLVSRVITFRYWREMWETYWPLAASLLMFLPLVTLRSQQFHPWYLVWVLVWLPLFARSDIHTRFSRLLATLQSVWVPAVVVLSVSSMTRYIPWLWAGGFEGNVLLQQKLVTWVPFVAVLVVLGIRSLVAKRPG